MIARFLLGACALIALLVFAPSAPAATFCVGSSPSCTGSPLPDFSFDVTGLQGAVTAANNSSGADTIRIKAGTIPLSANFNPSYDVGEDVTIIGAGRDQTVFSSTIASGASLTFGFMTTGSSASGFNLETSTPSTNGFGIIVSAGTVEDFEVHESSGVATNFRGVAINFGGTARRGEITTTSPASSGIMAQNQDANASDLVITGGNSGIGVHVSVPTFSVDLARLRIGGFSTGVEIDQGVLELSDSVIDMGSTPSGIGVNAFNGNSGSNPISTTLNRLTIVGTGNGQRALSVGADSPSETFIGTFDDLVLFGTGTAFKSVRCIGGGLSLTADWGYYATNGTEELIGGCAIGAGTKTTLTADPGFRDFAGGDFRPLWNSVLVDAGNTTSGAPDLDGNTRTVDGDGSGSTSTDLGAYEYQRRAPVVTLVADKSTPAVQEAVTFTAGASDAEGEALTYAWTIDGSPSPNVASSLNGAFISSGSHTVAVAVTDAAGATTRASTTVNVICSTTRDVRVKIKSKPTKAFRNSNKGFVIAKPKAKQPLIRITAPAGEIEVVLHAVGKKKLKKISGSQRLKVKAGTTKLRFGGRWNRKSLKAGKYRATISPVLPAASSCVLAKPASLTFSLK